MRPTWGLRLQGGTGRASVPCSALLRVGFAEPPGSPRALVRSYRTVSPLPVLRCPVDTGAIGGLFSVALSCGSPRLAANQHPALWSPDLPRPGHCRAAATRPTHRHPQLSRTALICGSGSAATTNELIRARHRGRCHDSEMKPSLRTFILATLPAVLAVPVWATAASGAILSCGQTITQTTVLDNDLSNCASNGIVVGASNITLDLNGHTVAGTAASGDQGGIVLVGRTGVTVKNGTVKNFDVGVVIEGGSANTVQNISARDNISFSGTVNRGGDGIAILSSSNNRILYNSTVNNGPFSGIGIY